MHACIVVISDKGLLGLFESRKVAEDSIEFSYHKRPHTTEKRSCHVTVRCADGEVHDFEVREQIIESETTHL